MYMIKVPKVKKSTRKPSEVNGGQNNTQSFHCSGVFIVVSRPSILLFPIAGRRGGRVSQRSIVVR
jgi:hypothetical protein